MTFAKRIVTFGCAVLATIPALGQAQNVSTTPPKPGDDSVVMRASKKYGASGWHAFLLGDNYRDLWYQPITVPMLDLAKYDGGMTALVYGSNALDHKSSRLISSHG